MPPAIVRRTVFIFAAYLTVTAALVLWTRSRATDRAWDTMEGIAKLISHHIAFVVSDEIQDHESGEIGDERLRATIEDLAERSETVRLATLIGADGRLIASNDPAAWKLPYSSPRQLFTEDPELRIRTRSASSLRRGEFQVEIPFILSGEPVAYLHLNLMSESIAGLYRSTYVSQLVMSTLGVVTIGVFGVVLHLRHEQNRRRRDRWFAAVVEGGDRVDDLVPPPSPPAPERVDGLYSALADSELRAEETKRQLSRLDRALDVGLVVVGSAGSPEIVGERARELLGIESQDPTHHEAAAVLSDVLQTVRKVIETREIREIPLEVTGTDPSKWLDIRVLPLALEDERRALLQLRDRNQVRTLERNLLDAARLRGLTRLYLGVAHDLRAPLNAIALNVANLQHSLSEAADLPNQQENCRTIDVIERELQRLQRSIEALLRHTEPVREESEELDLRDVVEDLELLVRPQARQQRLDLNVVTPPDERPTVVAQRDWVLQALLNLIVNAFDATPEGGSVEVRIELGNDWVDTSVSDTGSGIPADIVPHLFKMYTTTKCSGSGVGLFVARSAIEACSGTLALVRTGPDGTAFRIRLPRAKGNGFAHTA